MTKSSNKKTNDLKLTEDELKDLQTLITAINKLRIDVGELEIQKSLSVKRWNSFREDLNKMELDLKEKYGQVTINVNDGTLTEIPKDETDTKN